MGREHTATASAISTGSSASHPFQVMRIVSALFNFSYDSYEMMVVNKKL
jgi:hypothetical protein